MHVFDCEVRSLGAIYQRSCVFAFGVHRYGRDASCLGKITPHSSPLHRTQEIEEDE
jgi:hypothetical protein